MEHKNRTDSSALSDHVFQYLSSGIQEGLWKPGDQLPTEAQLCGVLEVSRTTVRRAIGRLAGMGLAKSVQGKGTFVCQTTPPVEGTAPGFRLEEHLAHIDRLTVFEFRKIIESESAALAAIRAKAEDVEEIEQSILTMEADRSPRDTADQDMAFHYLIARASGNEIIHYIFETMRSTYARMFEDNVAKLGNVGIEQHRRILLAIQTRDMESARQCMLKHVEDTMRLVCRP